MSLYVNWKGTFLFLGYAKDVIFIWVEAHEPILFSSFSCAKVLLKVCSIVKRVYLFVYGTIIFKKS